MEITNPVIFDLQTLVKEIFKTNEKLPFETEVLSFNKHDKIIKPGMIENNMYLVLSGVVQAHINDKKGDEKIMEFYFPKEIFSSTSSFITQKPNEFTFTCVTDCLIEAIPRESFNRSLEYSMLAHRLKSHYLECTYLKRLKKEKDLFTKSAMERYTDLLDNNPEYIQNFPVNKIARYLGIHPFSLSRLRRLQN